MVCGGGHPDEITYMMWYIMMCVFWMVIPVIWTSQMNEEIKNKIFSQL